MSLLILVCVVTLPFLLSLLLGMHLRPLYGLVGLIFVVLALPLIWTATMGQVPSGPGRPGWAAALDNSVLTSRYAMVAIWLGAMATGFAVGMRSRIERRGDESA
ncbi:hypothetical protein [Mesobacterium pallidum]|uniref:hypothetical protein n=1 Tax=Mesobacterium pallidum TaxID=2872037 RepID=UPI001EE18701|nr:hypothetical protein [Mesobacterium pallidum]